MVARETQALARSRAAEAAGDAAAALRWAALALAGAAAGDAQAAALGRSALIHLRLGRLALARQLADQALARAATPAGLAGALIAAGACAAAQDDLAAGEAALQQAIDLSRQCGAAAAHSRALQHLAGQIHLRRGQFALARAAAEAAAQLGPPERRAPAWLLLAWVGWLSGDRPAAHADLDRLDREAPPDARLAAAAACLRAQLALDAGDQEAARPLLAGALDCAEATGHPLLLVGARLALSRRCLLADEPAAAAAWADAAAAVARRIGSRHLEGQAQIARGRAAWLAGDLPAAEAELRAALAALDALGSAYDAAHAALLLGALLWQPGHPEAAPLGRDAARRIVVGGYLALIERERAVALPLLAAWAHHADPELRDQAGRLIHQLMQIPPPPLHVVGLGDWAVRQGGCAIPAHRWEPRKAGELLRFLLVQPRQRACRDLIREALWPGKGPAAAERLLQQATWALRHVLEPDLPEKFPSRYLAVADRQVALTLPAGSTVDAQRFEQAVVGALAAPHDALEPALALYGGELFPIDRYAGWSAAPREHLASLYLRGLGRLAERHLAERRPEQALRCCDQIAAAEPWSEDAARIAMLACRALGDRPGALRRYEALRRALRHDLRLAPRADLRDLAEAIRGEM